ncbi:hypothetical protein RIF29_24998 [Crotalaria pallida]|uniref:Uncharacterized protein n=1 Tax=Crotalaria pallida TaxID=3830 RepID=A0AAN9I3S4_CROPI
MPQPPRFSSTTATLLHSVTAICSKVSDIPIVEPALKMEEKTGDEAESQNVQEEGFENITGSEEMLYNLVSHTILEVAWGKFSMVEAEKRLLARALLDPDNQHFVLLSESSVSVVYLCATLNTCTTSYCLQMSASLNVVLNEAATCYNSHGRQSILYKIQASLQLL